MLGVPVLFKLIAGIGLLFATSIVTQAQAQDCRLVSFGELPVSRTPAGRAVLPATLDGKPVALALDLESPVSTVARADVEAWKSTVREAEVGLVKQGRDSLTELATFGLLNLGAARFNGFQAFVDPKDMHGADLVFGRDLLRNFTPEFDVGHNMVRLFGKSACPDKLVYWASDYLQMDYRLAADRLLVDGKINGVDIHAAISPGLARSAISPAAAVRLGGARPDGAALVETLEFGGIKLHNLSVDIRDLMPGRVYGGESAVNLIGRQEIIQTDFLLGDDVLKHLRFMIDFATQKISFTVG